MKNKTKWIHREDLDTYKNYEEGTPEFACKQAQFYALIGIKLY